MKRLWAKWHFGLRTLLELVAVIAVVLGLAIEVFLRGPQGNLSQQIVVHHFERASWFAMNTERYEGASPEIARQFRQMAVWHARRGREFQRMALPDVGRESERDLGHDLLEGRLLEQALRYDQMKSKSDGVGACAGEGCVCGKRLAVR